MSFDNYKLWDTRTSLGVMQEQKVVPTFFMNFFNESVTSEDEYIDLEQVAGSERRLAVFVAPMADGQPVYAKGSRLSRFKTAYIKLQDPVTPQRALKGRPGKLLGTTAITPMARYNAIKADILRQHRQTISNRKEWMAAKALVDGKVVIEGPGYPTQIVDFQRDAAHDITLADGAKWGDAAVSIIDNLQDWSDIVAGAEFGGVSDVLVVTRSVWKIMRKDRELKEQLDTTFRGSQDAFVTGLIGSREVEYVGRVGNLDIVVYSGYYEEGGVRQKLMDDGEILLIASQSLQGHQCHGAIQDVRADFQPYEIFSRNYLAESDTAEQIQSQSAPLMVPVNANCTLRARVL